MLGLLTGRCKEHSKVLNINACRLFKKAGSSVVDASEFLSTL